MAYQNLLTIAGRQFRSYFNGPVAYIVICIMLIALGAFFWTPFFLMNHASVREMFRLLGIVLAFAVRPSPWASSPKSAGAAPSSSSSPCR